MIDEKTEGFLNDMVKTKTGFSSKQMAGTIIDEAQSTLESQFNEIKALKKKLKERDFYDPLFQLRILNENLTKLISKNESIYFMINQLLLNQHKQNNYDATKT